MYLVKEILPTFVNAKVNFSCGFYHIHVIRITPKMSVYITQLTFRWNSSPHITFVGMQGREGREARGSSQIKQSRNLKFISFIIERDRGISIYSLHSRSLSLWKRYIFKNSAVFLLIKIYYWFSNTFDSLFFNRVKSVIMLQRIMTIAIFRNLYEKNLWQLLLWSRRLPSKCRLCRAPSIME